MIELYECTENQYTVWDFIICLNEQFRGHYSFIELY